MTSDALCAGVSKAQNHWNDSGLLNGIVGVGRCSLELGLPTFRFGHLYVGSSSRS